MSLFAPNYVLRGMKTIRLGSCLLGSLFAMAALGREFRISEMGPDGTDGYLAGNPDVVYNAAEDEYLVVWDGTDDTSPLVQFENEIFAQRLSGATGEPLMSAAIRVSFMGPDGNINYQAQEPRVAWNSDLNEYVVVWWGDDNTGSLVDGEREVYAQRLSHLARLEGDVVRVSFMGEDGDDLAEAISPEVVYNPEQGEYYVVWQGDDIDDVSYVNQDYEIFGQRLDASTLAPLGSNQRLSDMGEMDANPSFTAQRPDVTYNAGANEYLVVWEGDDDGGDTVDGEVEIYGQRVNAVNGMETGTNDFRISFLGPVGAIDYDSGAPAVVHNSIVDEYLVVWSGAHDMDGAVRNDYEIYVQRLTSAGMPVGPTQRRISSMGDDGSTAWWALHPDVAVNAATGGYLVAWQGEDNAGDLVNNEYEIYTQELTAAAGIDGPRRRVSRMGPDGEPSFFAALPVIAHDADRENFLIVFVGNDDRELLAPGEREIFGHSARPDEVFESGFE